MTLPVEGLVPGLKYNTAGQKLYLKFTFRANDGTQKSGVTPTVTIYGLDGAAIASDQNLTQDGTTSWYYITLDLATSVGSYPKGVGYRAYATFTENGTSEVHYEEKYFSVVQEPINDPLVTTDEIDADEPTWASFRPKGWSDWTRAVFQSHVELMRHFNRWKDESGNLIYVHHIMYRAELKHAALMLAKRYIVQRIPKLKVWVDGAHSNVKAALAEIAVLIVDKDDDRIVDEDSEIEGTIYPGTLLVR